MDAHDVIEELPITEWHGPFDAALRTHAMDALEAGRVLLAAGLPFRIAPDEAFLLSPTVMGSERKNISLDPATGKTGNTSLGGAEATNAGRRCCSASADGAERMLRDLLPGYAAALERARTSFRPAEIAGREYSPRHDDGCCMSMRSPAGRCAGGGSCGCSATSLLTARRAPGASASRSPISHASSCRGPARRCRAAPGCCSGWASPRAAAANTTGSCCACTTPGSWTPPISPAAPKADVAFPAGTTWLCFTDQVLHAALAGHCALEQTFHLPVAAMAHPERSPLRVLERLAGRALA